MDLPKSRYETIIKDIVQHLPEIGRWKDVIELIGFNKITDEHIINMIKTGIDNKDGLLAKWLPRQGAKAKFIAYSLEMDHGDYRRLIVSLSSTVEQQMCKNQWSEINYDHVPSIANKKYSKAFMRNDMHRRDEYLDRVMNSDDTNMKSSVLYPHDIVKMIRSTSMYEFKESRADDSSIKTANALWKSLPNYMEEAVNVLPIIDVSGSMYSDARGTSARCIEIAIGLGLYFAEHNTGSYKDVWMNFSQKPEIMKLKGNRLSE
jgi:hypothetical protein